MHQVHGLFGAGVLWMPVVDEEAGYLGAYNPVVDAVYLGRIDPEIQGHETTHRIMSTGDGTGVLRTIAGISLGLLVDLLEALRESEGTLAGMHLDELRVVGGSSEAHLEPFASLLRNIRGVEKLFDACYLNFLVPAEFAAIDLLPSSEGGWNLTGRERGERAAASIQLEVLEVITASLRVDRDGPPLSTELIMTAWDALQRIEDSFLRERILAVALRTVFRYIDTPEEMVAIGDTVAIIHRLAESVVEMEYTAAMEFLYGVEEEGRSTMNQSLAMFAGRFTLSESASRVLESAGLVVPPTAAGRAPWR